ncbi:lipopolysaccharide-induced tumor necrosis factor-alpha factor homolog [Babylonia areolata]|uniref:lipopolysaccharide-induced tumor necrosis factor-alpha factor homolog n=1 Tax=Babylonia areolata TaxID=304850 RepID=UPI003FD55193
MSEPAPVNSSKQSPPPPPGYSPPPQAAYSPSPGYPQSPAPPPGYPQSLPPQPGYPQTPPVIMVTHPVQVFYDLPVRTVCPFCQAEVVTVTTYKTGLITWVLSLTICLLGCVFGCCLIPFFYDSTKDVVHTCPRCNQKIGKWSRR